jgi:adenine-specific DNA-methyltransferase
MDEPEKLDLRSHDIAEDKKQELLRLFPEIQTEGKKIDLERLKLAIGETVDVGKERYGMNWPGKADCFKAIQSPSLGTLRPCPEESVNYESTENLIIEGDNLEVLKLLQKSYLGKVKLIFYSCKNNIMLLRVDRGALKVLGTTDGSLKDL